MLFLACSQLICYEINLQLLRCSYFRIKIHSQHINDVGLVDELGLFLEYEKIISEYKEEQEVQAIFRGLKGILGEVLRDQQYIVSSEIRCIQIERSIFEETANSIMIEAERAHHQKTFDTTGHQFHKSVTKLSSEIDRVTTHSHESVLIVQALLNALKEHPEWEDLCLLGHSIRENHATLSESLQSGLADIDEFSVMFETIQRIKLPDLEVGDTIHADDDDKPVTEMIKYDSISRIAELNIDGKSVARITTKFIHGDPLSIAEEKARAGFKVLLVQLKENYFDDYALLEEQAKLPNGIFMAKLLMSPIDLANHPNLLDKHAINEDGNLIVNLRGQAALKKRMFLPFKVAEDNEYAAIVMDCNFGDGVPFLNNPSNLGYTYLAATALYTNVGVIQFILAGDVKSSYCHEIKRTMSQYSEQ